MLLVAAIAAAGCSRQASAPATDYASEVNPFIGTDYTGNTYPGAQWPHGLVQLSPDNGLPGWDRIAGYYYPDSTIAGFSHTHLSGTGAGDLYDISFMPVTDPVRKADAPLGIHSRFSHDSEEARAGYYKVTLDDYGIDVELTATEHCGIQRYTWPGDSGKVILDLAKAMNWDATKLTGLEVIDSVTVAGFRFSDGWARNQKVWFATRFSKPFESVEIDSVAGHVATFGFATTPGEQLTVVTAISGTDAEGAAANLAAEAPHSDFDRYLAEATAKWNSMLGSIEIDTADPDERTVFYTALYHSLLAPVVFSDADGRIQKENKDFEDAKKANAPEALENVAAGEKYLTEAKAADPEIKTTESGLSYKIENAGDDTKITRRDVAQIKYTGRLVDGTVFDSSDDARLSPAGVVPGFGEGLQMLGKGGKATLYIPGKLAYGVEGAPRAGIGPNAMLIFDIEVLDVNPGMK